MQTLSGHTSPATAYVVEDYPYGFRLRCTMRHWIEFKRGHGFRHVTQTSNPKKAGDVWNKPRAGTYHPVLVLTVDEDGRVEGDGLNLYASDERIDTFEERHAAALTDEHRAALRFLRAANRTAGRISFTIQLDDGTPRQTVEEQAAIYRAVIADELRRDRPADVDAPAPKPEPEPIAARQAVTPSGTAWLLPGVDPAPARRGDADQLAIF